MGGVGVGVGLRRIGGRNTPPGGIGITQHRTGAGNAPKPQKRLERRSAGNILRQQASEGIEPRSIHGTSPVAVGPV